MQTKTSHIVLKYQFSGEFRAFFIHLENSPWDCVSWKKNRLKYKFHFCGEFAYHLQQRRNEKRVKRREILSKVFILYVGISYYGMFINFITIGFKVNIWNSCRKTQGILFISMHPLPISVFGVFSQWNTKLTYLWAFLKHGINGANKNAKFRITIYGRKCCFFLLRPFIELVYIYNIITWHVFSIQYNTLCNIEHGILQKL